MDVTRGRISRILELREMLLSFLTGFNLVKAPIQANLYEPVDALQKTTNVILRAAHQVKPPTNEKKKVAPDEISDFSTVST